MLEKSAEELIIEKLRLSQGLSSSDQKPNGLKDMSDSEEKGDLTILSSDNSTHPQFEVFKFNENIQIRSILRDDEVWFVAKDVCEALNLKNVSGSCSKLEADEKSDIRTMDSVGRPTNILIISEPGLYHLIGTSYKPEAKIFIRWVNHEVLPSIRKTGSYSLTSAPKSDIELVIESFTKCVETFTNFQKTADLKLNYLYEIHKSAEIKSENQFHLLTNLISQQMNISAQTNTTLAVNTYQTQVANKATFVSQTITHATVKDFLKNRNQKLNNIKYYPRLVSDTLSKILKQNPGRCNGKLVEMHGNVKAFPIELLTWYFESKPDSLINLI